MVSVIDAADEQAMVAYMLAVTRLGNLRATTLRAWNADEMREIVGQLPQVGANHPPPPAPAAPGPALRPKCRRAARRWQCKPPANAT